MARRRNPSRRNPSKAVYIATGIVAAAAVLYLMMRKDETAVTPDTSTDTSTVDLTTGRSGVRGGKPFTRKVEGTTPAEKLAYAQEHPQKYDANGTVVVITKREARRLVNSGEYHWNVVQTAVIHNSRV